MPGWAGDLRGIKGVEAAAADAAAAAAAAATTACVIKDTELGNGLSRGLTTGFTRTLPSPR